MKISRYGVYWANLDPVVGSEANKTRPVVVISDNGMNAMLKTVVVCPLTSQLHPEWRCRIQVQIKGNDSDIAVDQIRSISKSRLMNHVGNISSDCSYQLRLLINEMYGE